MSQYSLYVINYVQLLISKFMKGYTMFPLKKYTVLFISLYLIFFLVSLILSKSCPFRYTWPSIILWPYSSSMSSVAFISSTTFTNYVASTDFTSAAIAYILPGYKKLSSSSPAVVKGSSCPDQKEISFKSSPFK